MSLFALTRARAHKSAETRAHPPMHSHTPQARDLRFMIRDSRATLYMRHVPMLAPRERRRTFTPRAASVARAFCWPCCRSTSHCALALPWRTTSPTGSRSTMKPTKRGGRRCVACDTRAHVHAYASETSPTLPSSVNPRLHSNPGACAARGEKEGEGAIFEHEKEEAADHDGTSATA